MESESGTNNTKLCDSGYSNSCSNTTSQGSASSKSRHSGGSNSSHSSGYGGGIKQNDSEESSHPQTSNRREHKKKKQNPLVAAAPPSLSAVFTVPAATPISASPVKATISVENVPSPSALEIPAPENLDVEIKHNNMGPLLTTVVPLVQNNSETIMPLDPAEVNIEPWANIIIEPAEENSAENKLDKETFASNPMPPSQLEVNDGFCCIISMSDGVVLYTTPSLTSVLGFPKDSWLGHSFIDFVHPKDRETFSNQVNSSVALPLVDSQGKVKDVRNYLYACLRRHSAEKPVSYQAFHLTVTIKQMGDSSNNGLFLVIIAVPVFSAYKVPGERKKSTKCVMRHTAACMLSYVDPDVVTSFGFLPQDMLGKSVFDFYHPDDMPYLKEVYTSVMKTCRVNGSVFRSKPYRFLIQNGCFAMIEAEWSSMVNPWSKRLEFVISLYQVVQGPLNANVFDTASEGEALKNVPQQIIKQGKVLQAEILQILAEGLPRPAEIGQEEVSKRCSELANFMESLMNTSKLVIDVAQDPSISERDSVMLGEISPHHDFCDSKSSSETPPSYTQLNYNENISRFFQSNPKTTAGTSDESNSASNVMDIDGKNSQDCGTNNNEKCLSPLQNSGGSGYGSSGSSPNIESGSNTSNDDYKSPHLTESILVRHNEDMEKIMIQKHKKERSHIKDQETKKSQQKLEKYANDILRDDTNEPNHGLKRSGSNSWRKDGQKPSKHCRQDGATTKDNRFNTLSNCQQAAITPNAQIPAASYCRGEPTFNGGNDLTMWPSFSVNPHQSLAPNSPYNEGMVPVYYMPTFVQPRAASNNMEPAQRYQVQYMPVVCNYNPIFLPQPILCPTVPLLSVPPVQNSSSPMSPVGPHFGNNNLASPKVNPGTPGPAEASGPSGNGAMPPCDQFGNNALDGSRPVVPQCDRPSSQATSVKAEPGSRMGSTASASVVVNKALSECSRKDLCLQSVCSPDTPLVSPPDGETQAEQFNANAKTSEPINRPQQAETYRTKRVMDEESSCYSSSYSSFLKTDTTSGSNDDSTSNNNSNRSDNRVLKQQRKTYPMRKKDPPWVESVSVSSDLIYRYRVAVRDLEDILKSDLDTLKGTEQPMMVNDQLHQLYIEMELDGLSKALTLEEGFSSGSSSSDENSANNPNSSLSNKPKKQKRSYSSLVMIYEEEAPLPPPEINS